MALTTDGPLISVHRYARAFFEEGAATFGEATTWYPLDANACRTIGGSGSPAAPTKEREDAFGTATRRTPINLKRTGSLQWNGYLIPPGTSGTDPDLAEVFRYGGFNRVNHSGNLTTSGTGSTVTTLDVTDASAVQVGLPLMVNGYVCFATAVDTGASPHEITITPPLPAAAVPGDSVTVYTGVAFWPKDERDATPDSLTAWLCTNRLITRALGWAPERFSAEFGGDDAGKISIEGPARRVDYMGSGVLNGAINNSVTSIAVDNDGFVPFNTSTTRPAYFTILDSGNGDEHIRVDAASGGTLTVARGQLSSSAVAHADDAVIVPYIPDGTYAGDPVPAISGYIVSGDASTRVEMELNTATVDCGVPVTQIEDVHGDDSKMAGYTAAMRDVGISVRGWSHRQTMESFVFGAADREQVPLLVQQGTAAGSCCGVWMPNVLFEQPSLDLGQEQVAVDLTGKAYGTSQNEVAFFTI